MNGSRCRHDGYDGPAEAGAKSTDESDSCCPSMALKEPNFRFARQPPTIVTWAELHFYDLPLIRPSGFVNSAALMGQL